MAPWENVGEYCLRYSTLTKQKIRERRAKMTIEIHKPELEALIIERLKSGGFETIEDVLMQALQSSSLPAKEKGSTGTDLIAAMQASPYREIDLQPDRTSLPVRDVAF